MVAKCVSKCWSYHLNIKLLSEHFLSLASAKIPDAMVATTVEYLLVGRDARQSLVYAIWYLLQHGGGMA